MKHILIVDDNTTSLKVESQMLQSHYEVSMAKSGKQALAFLKKYTPDLILLDLLMPDMDGYQTMEEIKLNPRTANIPIIFLTADTQRESEIKGLQLGALDFITKPFEEDVVLGRIEKVLVMDDMRKGLFEEDDKSSDTGLYTFDFVKDKVSSILDSGRGGALLLLKISNLIKIRENALSRSFSSYMGYVYDFLRSESFGKSLSAKIDDETFMICLTSQVDEIELSECLNDILNHLTKEIESECGKIRATIDIGAFLICQNATFDEVYSKADKALYHVLMSDDIHIHVYRNR